MDEKEPVKSEIAKREEATLKFWQENKIFEKSLEKPSPNGEFVFYDGPPFATGLPHFGHLLPTSLKDVVPRYQTMKGKRVRRQWGWDCHGLPIENLIEKELGLDSKKAIEEYGIANFNRQARESVFRYADEWKKIIPRMGRWVDMENDYKTLNSTYTESVWWVFKTLYDKGLVYEGFKSMHLCPHCETTLANFEVNQGYKDTTDLSVTVKFELVDEPGTFLLAWTTTPWTLPGNVALAVGPEIDYVEVKFDFLGFSEKSNFDGVNPGTYILAEEIFWAGLNSHTHLSDKIRIIFGHEDDLLHDLVKFASDRHGFFDKHKDKVRRVKGKNLIGKKYKPLFDYYSSDEKLKNRENGWKVYGADFVTTEDGTGIVHIAPAFGEDDLNLGNKENLPFVQHVGTDGRFKAEVKDFAGQLVKPKSDDEKTRLSADINIIRYLQEPEHNNYFAKEKITHPYPHCWRCDTPLLNYASSSWFVKVTALKDKMVALNAKVGWVPENIRDGRFGKWLEGARDWALSRSRFWGAPIPVWKCQECDEIKVVGSIAETKHAPRNQYFVMRHGEAESNVRQIVSAKVPGEYHLTEKGRGEVEVTADKLATEKIDLIISSPVLRTRETAEMVAEKWGLTKDQVVIDERLREMGFGDLEGESVAQYHANPATNGESMSAVRARAMQMLYEFDAGHKDKKILLITHEAIVCVLKDVGEFPTGQSCPLDFQVLPHNENFELDLHRPYIDEVKFACACGGEMRRTAEVFDVWFESGSMPYGQLHYPFENQELFKRSFPADFIAEGLDQTRGWFYVLLVLATGLFDETAFKNVVVNGLILAEDGRKMSKRLQNYPDLNLTIDKYGADALRFYLLSSPAVHAEEFNFSERGLGEVQRRVIARLQNVLSFYEMYAIEPFKFNFTLSEINNPLDLWILNRLAELNREVGEAMDCLEIDRATRPVDLFIDDFSNWYLRRSRDRFKSGNDMDKLSAMVTIRQVLKESAKIFAPLMPFVAEEIYLKVKGNSDPESVHLCDWPKSIVYKDGKKIIEEMAKTRQVVSTGLEARAKAGMKVRQPLASVTIVESLASEYLGLIKDELNVEEVKVGEVFNLDTNITPALKEKGDLRDLIREIQDWRKQQNLKPGELAVVPIAAEKQALAEKFAAELKAATSASGFEFGK